ncbi:MAG: viperin family antiviral radical SAM protein [Candidatus Thorarchaeota archaeon]
MIDTEGLKPRFRLLGPDLSVVSVNWHVWPSCNYRCIFCFARFDRPDGRLSFLARDEGLELISQLVDSGMEKISFVGGEPMLCPYLGDYIRHAKGLGCLTMVVTNGSLITDEFLKRHEGTIDWIGLSMDSSDESKERTLGRGYGNHLTQLISVAKMARRHGIRLKLNVTVTRPVLDEDLHHIIRQIQPDRLKFFQVLRIEGQNDDSFDDLSVSREEFEAFVNRHRDLDPIAEDNEMMTGSYVMIDPLGRFFQNTQEKYIFSRPINEIGVMGALKQVGFSWSKLLRRRGAEYFADGSHESVVELGHEEGF